MVSFRCLLFGHNWRQHLIRRANKWVMVCDRCGKMRQLRLRMDNG